MISHASERKKNCKRNYEARKINFKDRPKHFRIMRERECEINTWKNFKRVFNCR